MEKPKREMEGGFRLVKIRKIKTWLYVVQLIVMVFFAIVLMITNNELSMSPLHIGLSSFLYFVLIMLIVINVEGFIFLRLETRFVKSPSTKYYMARDSIKRSYVIIIVALIIMVMFLLPVAASGLIKTVTESDKTYSVSPSTGPVKIKLNSADLFGLTNLNSIAVTTDGGQAYVFLVSEDNFQEYGPLQDKLAPYRINADFYEAYPGLTYTVPDLVYGAYYLVIYSPTDASLNATVTMDSEIDQGLVGYVPWLCLMFVVANIVWIFYLRPIVKIFERRAIYR
jgi:hypothetical protein